MTIQTVGIDLAKTVFYLIGIDGGGQIICKKRFSRSQLTAFMVNRPSCLVGMEACCGSHLIARVLAKQGHDVRLIPAQFVRPFVKSNKNDYVDAEAIAEAVQPQDASWVGLQVQLVFRLDGHRSRSQSFSQDSWNPAFLVGRVAKPGGPA